MDCALTSVCGYVSQRSSEDVCSEKEKKSGWGACRDGEHVETIGY
jgi:hypothetical protein